MCLRVNGLNGRRPGVSDDGKPVLEVSVLERGERQPVQQCRHGAPDATQCLDGFLGSALEFDPVPAPQQLFHEPYAWVADGRGRNRTPARRAGEIERRQMRAVLAGFENRAPPPYSQAVGLENVGGLQLFDRTRDDMRGERFRAARQFQWLQGPAEDDPASGRVKPPEGVRTLGH